MFSKLKEKLKSALSIFSKKTEEIAEEKVIEIIAEPKEISSTEHKTISEEAKEKKITIAEKKDSPVKKEKVVKKKKQEKQPVKNSSEKNKSEEKEILDKEGLVSEEKKEKEGKKEPEPEKKSFFSKIKEKFQKKEEVHEEIAVEEKKPEGEISTAEEAVTEKVVSESKPATGFFEKIKQAITTKTISAEKFDEIFWDLELLLLENNMAVEVIEKIKADLKQELVDKPLPRDVEGKITETLKQTLQEILSLPGKDILAEIKKRKEENTLKKEKKPYVIALFGINGAGKTTSLAKLTSYLLRNNHSVVWAASDTFRAAAIQQLEEHARKLSVKTIKHDYGADAAAVAFDAVKYAEKNNIEVVLIDTAGRLHSNTNLMAELEKIIRVAKPDLKLFVGESITGNDCIEQAKKFQELVDLDGVILTKADVDEKGGAALSISYILKKPILFFGVGQRYEDLEPFDKEKVLDRLGL